MLPLGVMALRVGDRLPVTGPLVPETTRPRGVDAADPTAAVEAEVIEGEDDSDAPVSIEEVVVEENSSRQQRLTVDLAKTGFVSFDSVR